MIKPEDLLTRLQNTIFSEDDKQKDDNNFDDNSGAFFNVTDLGQDSWIKTGWDPSTTNKPYPWEPGSMQGNVVEQDEKDEEKPKKEPVSPEPEVTPEEPKSQNVANGEYEGTAQDNMGMGNAGMGMEEEEPKEPKEKTECDEEMKDVDVMEFSLSSEEIDSLIGKLTQLKQTKTEVSFEVDDENEFVIKYLAEEFIETGTDLSDMSIRG